MQNGKRNMPHYAGIIVLHNEVTWRLFPIVLTQLGPIPCSCHGDAA
jgi:hypothetical protein